MEKELELLSEYMRIYIQLAIHNLEIKITCKYLPSFEEYKKHRESFLYMSFKESKYMINDRVANNYAHGLGTDDGVAYRFYSTCKGVKYFHPDNMNGDFTITEDFQKALKRL